MLLKMVGLHLLRHPDVFYPYIKEDLKERSYVSYCRNIYEGNVWGDDVMLAAIGHMWNLSISVIMPHSDILHLFHDNYEEPDIVVVVNGGPPESDNPATHFCATKSRLVNPKVPVVKGKVKVCDTYEFAKKVAENRREERLKKTIFSRLRSINFEIDGLEEQMTDIRQKMSEAKRKRDALETDLTEMGFNVASLRNLRKDRSKESYVPEGGESKEVPEYVPTSKQKDKEQEEQQLQPQQQHSRSSSNKLEMRKHKIWNVKMKKL